MKMKTMGFLVLRIALGAVFVISGFGKLTAPWQNFAQVIEKFEVVQGDTAASVARILPWAEFVGGVFLILGLWTVAALFLLWAMNSLFILLLSSAILRKLPLDQCGCFGDAVTFTVPQMLALDVFFWFCFLSLFWAGSRSPLPSLDERLSRNG